MVQLVCVFGNMHELVLTHNDGLLTEIIPQCNLKIVKLSFPPISLFRSLWGLDLVTCVSDPPNINFPS